MRDICIQWLEERGVTLKNMTDILMELQHKYVPDLTEETCIDHIQAVLNKREVQHAVLTALEIDRLAELKLLREPIQGIIEKDLGLYGIDEVLALAIVNVYGSIGFTNFGYLDKVKPGIIGLLDAKNDGKKVGKVATFIDDIVCAIVASAASRLAHSD